MQFMALGGRGMPWKWYAEETDRCRSLVTLSRRSRMILGNVFTFTAPNVNTLSNILKYLQTTIQQTDGFTGNVLLPVGTLAARRGTCLEISALAVTIMRICEMRTGATKASFVVCGEREDGVGHTWIEYKGVQYEPRTGQPSPGYRAAFKFNDKECISIDQNMLGKMNLPALFGDLSARSAVHPAGYMSVPST
eukprot:TRINITY_DN39720_c0_g2_i1.p1 TRINITY_DN39720_c0_g2~~TRINITY_DN39720_c0_g2_i1.p1  ORF type:complete len:193 (-),score=11.23 TRINITY_DN39720_c0_g2_i1:247-825(-)